MSSVSSVLFVLLLLSPVVFQSKEASRNLLYSTIPQKAFSNASAWLKYELSIDFSDEEQFCIEAGRILFKGKCRDIFGEDGCGNGEWLVYSKEEALNGRLRGVCRPKPCPSGYMYLGSDKKCYGLEDVQVVCSNLRFLYDFFGNGRCSCVEKFGLLTGDSSKKCYEFFKRGPCDITSVFVPMKGLVKLNLGECVRDPCIEFNSRNNGTYIHVMLNNGTEKCVKLANKSLCRRRIIFTTSSGLPGKYLLICQVGGSGYSAVQMGFRSVNCVPNINGDCVKILQKHPISPEGSYLDDLF